MAKNDKNKGTVETVPATPAPVVNVAVPAPTEAPAVVAPVEDTTPTVDPAILATRSDGYLSDRLAKVASERSALASALAAHDAELTALRNEHKNREAARLEKMKVELSAQLASLPEAARSAAIAAAIQATFGAATAPTNTATVASAEKAKGTGGKEVTRFCGSCGTSFTFVSGQGRPPVKCPACRGK
jgi:hypothetical protein